MPPPPWSFFFPMAICRHGPSCSSRSGSASRSIPPGLRQSSPALADQNPETAWRGHLAGLVRSRTIEAWSDRGLQIEERLLQALNFRPREMVSGVSAEVPPEIFARDLVAYREEAWVAPLAAGLSLRIQSLRLGAPPLLQEVLASYAAYFDQLTTPPPEKSSWWRRTKRDPRKIQPPDDATWQVALNQLWLRAERAHQNFLERNQTRKRYLDAFDRPVSGAFDESPPALLDVPRTRWQRYLDEIEERRGRQAF
jgi:hypothetical protein